MLGLETMAAQEGAALDTSIFNTIEWIDWTAIVILGVFFILGLFRGFVWQASRIISLITGYVVAGIYGMPGARLIQGWFDPETPLNGIPLYLSYVAIFIGVVVALSLVAHFVQKLIQKSGLSFYDRIGGGFLGVLTGGCVMIFILSVVYMFFPDFAFAQTARESKSMEVSQRALRILGDVVPEPVQQLFDVDEVDPGAEPEDPAERDLRQKAASARRKRDF